MVRRPPFSPARIGRGAHDLHEIGMQLEIAGDMFARRRIVGGIHHQLVQRAAGEGIDAFMGACRALFHQHIIAVLLDQGGDQMIDKTGIDEGRIRGHAHDDVGIQLLRRRRAKRASTSSSGPRTTVTPSAWHRIRRWRRRADWWWWRWRCLRAGAQALRRCTMCQSSGLPAMGLSTLPGSRVEPMRAWMTATTRSCSASAVHAASPALADMAAAGACRRRDRRAIRGRKVRRAAAP